MKKVITLLLTLLLLTSCSFFIENDNNSNTKSEKYQNLGELENFDDYFTVKGIGPEYSGNNVIDDEDLVIYIKYSRNIYQFVVSKKLREKFSSGNDLILPGNKLHFKGAAGKLNSGDGNYFIVSQIEILKKVSNPAKEEIDSLIATYKDCDEDIDCILLDLDNGNCPFECNISVNSKHYQILKKVMGNYINSTSEKCENVCNYEVKAKCKNYRCVTE